MFWKVFQGIKRAGRNTGHLNGVGGGGAELVRREKLNPPEKLMGERREKSTKDNLNEKELV